MQATTWEFRYRFWVLLAIYWAGFSAYSWDHRQTAVWLAGLLAGNVHASPGRLEWRVLLAVAAVLSVAAATLRTWASAYLQSRVVHDSRLHGERVVADGPYRFTRNPLYLGGLLLATGYGLLASRLGIVILLVGHVVFYSRLMAREEAELLSSLGERFQRYREAVPRLWPTLRSKLPPSGATPGWAQAFSGEAFLWIFAAAAVAYAIRPNWVVFRWAILVAVATYLALWPLWRRGRAETAEPASEAEASESANDTV